MIELTEQDRAALERIYSATTHLTGAMRDEMIAKHFLAAGMATMAERMRDALDGNKTLMPVDDLLAAYANPGKMSVSEWAGHAAGRISSLVEAIRALATSGRVESNG